jgi:hypothetical protein
MTILPGPLFKILVDGKPQSYRDTKLTAMGATHILKIRAPDNKVLLLQPRSAVERRSWSDPQNPTGEEWWADVLADPRARTRSGPRDFSLVVRSHGTSRKADLSSRIVRGKAREHPDSPHLARGRSAVQRCRCCCQR